VNYSPLKQAQPETEEESAAEDTWFFFFMRCDMQISWPKHSALTGCILHAPILTVQPPRRRQAALRHSTSTKTRLPTHAHIPAATVDNTCGYSLNGLSVCRYLLGRKVKRMYAYMATLTDSSRQSGACLVTWQPQTQLSIVSLGYHSSNWRSCDLAAWRYVVR
jgi:hypothetical protein